MLYTFFNPSIQLHLYLLRFLHLFLADFSQVIATSSFLAEKLRKLSTKAPSTQHQNKMIRNAKRADGKPTKQAIQVILERTICLCKLIVSYENYFYC